MRLTDILDERGDPCYIPTLRQRVHFYLTPEGEPIRGRIWKMPGAQFPGEILCDGDGVTAYFNRPYDDPLGIHRGMVLYGVANQAELPDRAPGPTLASITKMLLEQLLAGTDITVPVQLDNGEHGFADLFLKITLVEGKADATDSTHALRAG